MAVYEVVLRYEDRDEVRLTDRRPDLGSNRRMAGTKWTVESREAARYICVRLPERLGDENAPADGTP
jgi:hypothetical protein